jgi:predicted DNA-binding transcriptional regulator AlpA
VKQRKSDRSRTPVVQETTPPPASDLEEFVRVADLKRLFKVSRTTLWRWVRDGHLNAPTRLGKNVVAWRKSSVVEFLRRQENS